MTAAVSVPPSTGGSGTDLTATIAQFEQAVINRVQIGIGTQTYPYRAYLAQPEADRQNDEHDAVAQQFTRYVLEWLDFTPADWTYDRTVPGQRKNRPDYQVRSARRHVAFIWENKNSTLNLADDDLAQMQRYSMRTAGYAVWCNMRRILAVRFSAGDRLAYEKLADVDVAALFAHPALNAAMRDAQATQLALFQLLFSKARFSQFADLITRIAVDEKTFLAHTAPLDTPQSVQTFITGSRDALNHLRLAALAKIQESFTRRGEAVTEEQRLRQEWDAVATTFFNHMGYANLMEPVQATITGLAPRLGELEAADIRAIGPLTERTIRRRLSGTLKLTVEQWIEDATRINSAMRALRFHGTTTGSVAEAYRVWSERQTDQRDVRPEVFAEQVAYVFFVRLLLVRVLEDKHVIAPRLVSDGGFLAWDTYIKGHFAELSESSILSANYCNLLAQKAGHYYLHFFQQAVFDWFIPDDFLLLETLEFLCRFSFKDVESDIIGFTYEDYIERNAKKRKGHFLTRPDVVDYMLDLLNYQGQAVLGRRLLDPASGSGSFLVHAARRYRRALVTAICTQANLPDDEASLNDQPELRGRLAQQYLTALTTLFYGLEINPFACYLAEMNLLIQSIADLVVLPETERHPIGRFHIYNTDSLAMPREVLAQSAVDITAGTLFVEDRLSDRLVDDAYPIKAKLGPYASGFQFIISNPPYINASQVALNKDYKAYPFYDVILPGITNTYLLFLRLGMYYLAIGGRMIFIVPLSIIGDESTADARSFLVRPPFRATAIIRSFSGNILFPGVDQPVAIVRANQISGGATTAGNAAWDVLVGGGYTTQAAQQSECTEVSSRVVGNVPATSAWAAAWLVGTEERIYQVWEHVRVHATHALGDLWEGHLDVKKGDVPSDHLNPFRLPLGQRPAPGDVAVQKGEDLTRYAPLARTPAEWLRPRSDALPSSQARAVNATLCQVLALQSPEEGITMRKIARLNTRERLIATWFVRDAAHPVVFPDEQWRFRVLPGGDVFRAKALLALLNSRVIAYLLNLFSTNNNVAQREFARILIPEPRTCPINALAALADTCLTQRTQLEQQFVWAYHACLPDYDSGTVYLPPSAVLATQAHIPTVTIGDLVQQGLLQRQGTAVRLETLLRQGALLYTGSDVAGAQTIPLFLEELARNKRNWTQAQMQVVPDPAAAELWINTYQSLQQQAQHQWDTFITTQRQIDDEILAWYGLTDKPALCDAIRAGLPWARRQRTTAALHAALGIAQGATDRVPVTSQAFAAVGYEATAQILEIEFHDGEVQQYTSVPADIHAALMAAPSAGRYYQQYIRGHYTSYRLERPIPIDVAGGDAESLEGG